MKILMHPAELPQGLYQIVIAAVTTIDRQCETLFTFCGSENLRHIGGISGWGNLHWISFGELG